MRGGAEGGRLRWRGEVGEVRCLMKREGVHPADSQMNTLMISDIQSCMAVMISRAIRCPPPIAASHPASSQSQTLTHTPIHRHLLLHIPNQLVQHRSPPLLLYRSYQGKGYLFALCYVAALCCVKISFRFLVISNLDIYVFIWLAGKRVWIDRVRTWR